MRLVPKEVLFLILYRSEFHSSYEQANQHVLRIREQISDHGFELTPRLAFHMDYMLRELFNNAVEHGNGCDASKKVRYTLQLALEGLQVEVADEGGATLDVEAVLLTAQRTEIERRRYRGIASLTELGFHITSGGGTIRASRRFNDTELRNRRAAGSMEITVENGTALCLLKGDLITPNIKGFAEKVKAELEQRQDVGRLRIDFTHTASVDSMGITFLVGLYKTFQARGIPMSCTGVSESIMELFRIIKFDEILGIEAG